jgi:hypothetical protein
MMGELGWMVSSVTRYDDNKADKRNDTLLDI